MATHWMPSPDQFFLAGPAGSQLLFFSGRPYTAHKPRRPAKDRSAPLMQTAFAWRQGGPGPPLEPPAGGRPPGKEQDGILPRPF